MSIRRAGNWSPYSPFIFREHHIGGYGTLDWKSKGWVRLPVFPHLLHLCPSGPRSQTANLIFASSNLARCSNKNYITMRQAIISRLQSLGIDPIILKMYDEPHRYYHNFKHIQRMMFDTIDSGIALTDKLFLSIVFHDIIYNPKSSTNEIDSAELFKSYVDDKEVYDAILSTSNHIPKNSLGEILCKLDLAPLYDSSTSQYLEDLYNIFKEYQFVDFFLNLLLKELKF